MNEQKILELFEKHWENAYVVFGLESKPINQRFTPDVMFYNKGVAAGKACAWGRYVKYNTEIARVAGDAFENTIIHEIAHIITTRLYPRASAHGREWKVVFQKLGGNGQRCHNYDLAGTTIAANRIEATCSCKTHHISKIVANRMKKGAGYTCRVCKSSLSLVSV